MNDAAIGIFDSGVGGLTVARAILDQLPDEAIIYIGNTAHSPYGPRPIAEVRELSLAVLDQLVERDVKALVIACNSASAAMLRDARERYSIPVIEVIQPAVRRAVKATRNDHVGVIGTSATITSGAYEDALAELGLTLPAPPKPVATYIPAVLAGDYNVIPGPEDARNPAAWTDDALFQPESRRALRALKNLGLADAHELGEEPAGTYTFWDYQAGAWQRDHGIRIDFALLSPQAADRFRGIETHRDARDMEKPSDHVPVVVDLDLEV